MYHFKGSLTIGQVNKFTIEVDHDTLPASIGEDSLAIRVKNTTSALMRPALMTGPYILYTSVREQSYRHDTALGKGDFPPHFDANVKTNSSRWQSIPITSPPDAKLRSRTFVVEVAAQIVFSPSATVYFEITIGKNKTEVRHLARQGHVLEATTRGFNVSMEDTSTIWDMPPVQRDHPGHHIPPSARLGASPSVKYDASGKAYDHLVVLTHGIHSNLTSDMLYLKEMIEKTANKNGDRVICKGFAGNACNTERGVRWLAENVGDWLLEETGWDCAGGKVIRGPNPYKRISFIAHSLGGLVQMYVLGYLHDKTHGRIFNPQDGGLQPIHYITLATPWLGISAENPAYVKLALDFGLVGKTGQDLGLTTKPLGEYHVYDPKTSGNPEHLAGTRATVRSREPLLKLLSHPTAPSHIAIRLFRTRTIYANIENDGIVPLRTSSLFFLDWEQFSAQKAKVLKKLKARNSSATREPANETHSSQNTLQDEMKDMKLETSGSAAHSKGGGLNHSSEIPSTAENPNDYSSSDEPELAGDKHVQHSEGVLLKPQSDPLPGTKSNQATARIDGDTNRNDPASEQARSPSNHSPAGSISKLLSVAHAVNFASMIRRTSGTRVASKSSLKDESTSKHTASDTETEPQTPTTPIGKDSPRSPAVTISGPSDLIEAASHGSNGLLGLLKPSSSSRKPSKAFTRSQTIPKSEHHEADEGEEESQGEDGNEEGPKVHPEEPSKTSFFKSLESVLNPPMPELDYITDPAHREPPETVIVHDKVYYPNDIPPLKEIPPARSPEKHQSHSERRAEDKEHVRLEKIRLEETIAREWHKDMSWRKVLVKLRPDAHNNISNALKSFVAKRTILMPLVVRRMYPNCFGWPVIDHLAEHHFGPSTDKNIGMHDCTTEKEKKTFAGASKTTDFGQVERGAHEQVE